MASVIHLSLVLLLNAFFFATAADVQPNRMLVFPMRSTKISLDADHFFFILLPQNNPSENRTLILEVTFPTRTFTELDPSSIYTFIPDETFCLSCLKHIAAMKGDLYKGVVNVGIGKDYKAVKLLTSFWVSIHAILKNEDITPSPDSLHYLFLTPYTDESNEVLIMKKIDQPTHPKPLFQIVRADMIMMSNEFKETVIINQFTQFPITDSPPLREDKEYDSIVSTVKQTLANVKFKNIRNIVCLERDYTIVCAHTKIKLDNNFMTDSK